MRYLGNDTNLVREAALTGTNALGSDAIYRTDTAPKAGGGVVSLSGPYTGANDAAIDVEIVDAAGGSVSVSQPVFAGVGNGEMSSVSATAVDPQTVTVTLEDLGTETRSAYAPFQGVQLVARASGVAGNDIAIDVDHFAIVSAPTEWSLQEDLRQDANEVVGEHWNFGAAVLEPAGTIPADAPRLRFGNDPQVYRQYKRYRDGRYVYSFAPAPVRDVPRGARVHAISGARTMRISQGGITETMAGLVTLYDALTAIRDMSALVRVDGPIVNDRLPGGQGTTELSVRTRSYVLGVTNSGTGPIARTELRVSALGAAPTETLTVECVDSSHPGAEKWDVFGDVSGPLARATTGLLYADGKYTLTIPLPEVDPSATSGMMVVEYLPDGNHGENQPIPSLCVDRPRLGIAARDGEWTFTYARRPPEDCDCTTGDLEGGPNTDCLGTTPEGGDVSDASYLIRLQRLTGKVREFVASNTSPSYYAEPVDIRWIEGSAAIFADCLARFASSQRENPTWEADAPYAIDVAIETTARNGYRYAVTVAGTSGAIEPAWSTSPGATVTDGTVVWTNIGKTPYGMWDDAFEAWCTEMELIANAAISNSARAWASNTLYSGSSMVYPEARNGWLYAVDALNETPLSGSSEPAWPTTQNVTVADGIRSDSSPPFTTYGLWWRAQINYWNATSAVAEDQVITPGTGRTYKCTTSGTTGATEPEWGPEVITDGSVIWTANPASGNARLPDYAEGVRDTYFERFRTMASDILAAAGIAPNFDSAGTKGDGCWLDFKDSSHWWVFDGREPYLPIQTGHYYHASKMGMDETGKPYAMSTREFGFGPRFGCPEYLREGDRIRITITGVTGTGGRGYQVGDAFNVRVNQAGPLPFGGGQSGDDTLTWSVMCSVAGRLPDYALVTTTPAPYSAVVGAGSIGFSIAPGGIPFALGDGFDFALEGGRFRWRRDGGAWSSAIDLADTPLVDGLVARFAGGAAPSWLAGDAWSFDAEATHGVGQLRRPVDGEFAWLGSTVIDVADGGPIVGVLLACHTIPPDATITLLGSDDGFATTPFVVVLPWRRNDVWHAVVADHAAYRITIDRGGSLRWLYLGTGTQLTIRTGRAELGRLTKRVRLPGVAARHALAATVEHSALPQSSVDALLAMLAHACEHDDRRLGIVPNDAEDEVGIVRVDADTIDIADEFAFQPRDNARRLQSLTLQLQAAP